MVIWTLAKKDLRLLVGDRRAVVILLAMPILFILVLGIALGEDKLRVTVVDLDQGDYAKDAGFPPKKWSAMVRDDLEKTADIQVEVLSLEQARNLVNRRKRAAVVVFGPDFSKRVSQCSFLEGGINPFDRNGVRLSVLDAELLRDETQATASAIIEQVAQVTLLRVILPWMIGRAFEKIGDPSFLDLLKKQEQVPPPVKLFLNSPFVTEAQKRSLSTSLQDALQRMFAKYNLTGKTWETLTRPRTAPPSGNTAAPAPEAGSLPAISPEAESGLLNRGDLRYQTLVPSYTVMFAFFLVLTVGWLFVAERRQGTLKRLRAAPLSRSQILLGKMIPCFVLSVVQGVFLLAAGKAIFGLNWGSSPGWLLLVVVATGLAAMGMALLVASVAHTEAQVAIYGTLLVLILAGVSGCLMGDPELMPERMKVISRFTPHAWALDAYSQLLLRPQPNLVLVAQACAVLALFGAGFVALAWWCLKLEGE
ncbi:MAG: ABC transporter permease [Planctomycetes bacterium]|nr:ABC transporter permease [Planctomycetota bacterium]